MKKKAKKKKSRRRHRDARSEVGAFERLPVEYHRVLQALYQPGSRLDPRDLENLLSDRLRDWKLRDSYDHRWLNPAFEEVPRAEWVKARTQGYRLGRVKEPSMSSRRVRGILTERSSGEDKAIMSLIAVGLRHGDPSQLQAKTRREKWNAAVDAGAFDIHDVYEALAELIKERRMIRVPRVQEDPPKTAADNIQLLSRSELTRALDAGKSPKQIAHEAGCSLSTVYRRMKQYSLEPR